MDYLYWADSDHGTVTRIKRDGTGRQIVVEHFESMESIPVDWLPGEPKVVGYRNVYI
jgi:integrin beta 2